MIMGGDMLRDIFCQGFADEFGELRRGGFADVVRHPLDTRLEDRFACRIALRRP